MKNKFITLLSTAVVICLPLTVANAAESLLSSTPSSNPDSSSCQYAIPTKAVYGGLLQTIDVPSQVEPGELFKVNVKIQNAGNTPWFSALGQCPGQAYTYLGTTREQDRNSVFHAPLVFGETQWLGANRIKMKTLRANPGEIAEFEFTGHAPETPGLYREYFAPVVENVTWIKNSAEFNFDLTVGQPDLSSNIYKYTKDIPSSMNLVDPDFAGAKKIVVDLSEQKMYLKLGDEVLKTFRVSTGKARTPTPVGTTRIQFKQEVRVAGSYPHYIMPKFMQFRRGGYGIHALPSLANDRGVYWREALNHIGTPRSHGCIRLLPEDANFAFEFTDVGTEVQVVW
jgi:hypothetical protein